MRRGAVAAALVGVALVLSGCQYLLGPFGGGPIYPIDPLDPGFGSFDPGEFGSFDPGEPGFSLPPPEATYTKGSAVLTIDGVATQLDRLSGIGAMYKELGTEVVWTDGKGTYLRFMGYGDPGGGAFVSIDRIADGQHLGVADPTACTAKVDKMDATAISGSASCKDMRWLDMLGSFGGLALPSPGPTFDAEITFEATP